MLRPHSGISLPKHVQISPDEDPAAWGDPAVGAPPLDPTFHAPGAPTAHGVAAPPIVETHRTMVPEYEVEIDDESDISVPRPVPPVPSSEFPAPPLTSPGAGGLPPLSPIAAGSSVPSAAVAPVPSAVPAPLPGGPAPLLCALLSLFLPGAGQILAGQLAKGIVMLLLAFFTVGFCGLLNLLAAADAWLVAKRRHRGEKLGEWQFF